MSQTKTSIQVKITGKASQGALKEVMADLRTGMGQEPFSMDPDFNGSNTSVSRLKRYVDLAVDIELDRDKCGKGFCTELQNEIERRMKHQIGYYGLSGSIIVRIT